jgi:hypothetical protein
MFCMYCGCELARSAIRTYQLYMGSGGGGGEVCCGWEKVF